MSRRWISGIIACALIFFVVLAGALMFRSQEEYEPVNNVQTIDAQRSQVYVTGTGYRVDKDQKKIHEKVEKQKEKKVEEKKQDPNRNTPVLRPQPKKAAGPTGKPQKVKPEKEKETDPAPAPEKDDPRQEDPGEEDPPEEEPAQDPVITTSLINGDEVNGERVSFWVTVTDYQGRNVPVFSEDDGSFTVTCNGTPLTSDSVSGKKTNFRAEVTDGRNDFTITATDRKGNTKTLNRWITVNTEGEVEVTGTVSVTISAGIIGLGTIYSTDVTITNGDSAKDAVKRAFEKGGYTGVWDGSYLAGIKKSGIAEGAHISDEVREQMEELRQTEKDPSKQNKDQLKHKDFYESSGWMYSVNGTVPGVGMNSLKLEDGDEVNLYFILAEGVY